MEVPMERTVIEIHPYDLAELLQKIPFEQGVDKYRKVDDELFEVNGQLYHRTVSVPRTPGPHTIE
jgi:hypothetical protein